MKYSIRIPLLLLLVLLLALPSSGQIKIGQMLPDLTVDYVINYPDSSIMLSNFRGKWVLLDFWGIHCSSCIEDMPEMDSLQAVFGKKMQILMVDKETAETTEKYLGKYTGLKIASLF